MPGVVRPYTLTDVLATLNNQSGGQPQASAASTSFGLLGEADESIPATSIADSGIASANVPAGWDQGVWGGVGWQ